MKFCKTLDFFCLIYQGRVKLDGHEIIYLFQPTQNRDAQCLVHSARNIQIYHLCIIEISMLYNID